MGVRHEYNFNFTPHREAESDFKCALLKIRNQQKDMPPQRIRKFLHAFFCHFYRTIKIYLISKGTFLR